MKIIFIKTLLARLVTVLLAKPMLYWAARWVAKQSDNELDDHGVEFVIDLVENDLDGARIELQALLEKLGRGQ